MQLAPFLEFLKERAGDSLRAVEWYRADRVEMIYVRDDLDLEAVRRRADEMHASLGGEHHRFSSDELQGLGDLLATVDLREEAVLFNLPVEEGYGVVVGFDPEVAGSLHEFVDQCRRQLIESEDGDPSVEGD